MNVRYTVENGMASRTRSGSAVGIIMTVIGIWILAQAVIFTISSVIKSKTYVETQAVVVDYALREVEDEDGNRETLKSEIYEFEVAGTMYQTESNSASSSPLHIGEKVTIKYNPQNPYSIYEDNEAGVFIMLSIFGVVFLGLGIREIQAAGKQRRNNETRQNPIEQKRYEYDLNPGDRYLGL